MLHFERFRVYLIQMELYKQFINACILQPLELPRLKVTSKRTHTHTIFESLNVPSPPYVPNLVAHNFFLGAWIYIYIYRQNGILKIKSAKFLRIFSSQKLDKNVRKITRFQYWACSQIWLNLFVDDCHFCYITKLNPSPQKRGKKKSLHNTASQPACLLASLRPSLPPCLAAAAVAAVLLLWLQLHDHDHLLHCPDAQPRLCSAFLPWLLPICTTCAFIASCTHMRDRHTDRQTQRERERERESWNNTNNNNNKSRQRM